jgi:SlyX protein
MTTTNPVPDEARIEALEAACAHQDRVIAELSDAVAAQWARIDALTREVLRLRDEVQVQGERSAPDRPPPHY